ncbi:MAG: hypothetical protein HZA54_11275 [Planctomycetes bacterium]|nr:hypothetical protein [Planctomycetota bacterium]
MKLDHEVEHLYGLPEEERAVIGRYPHRVDRVDLLDRQVETPEEGEE